MIWGPKNEQQPAKIGLILGGGGARAAYQVGVLRAIAKMLPKNIHNPFPIICGTSAGAINATALAVNANCFRDGVYLILRVWKNLSVDQVFRSDALGLLKSGIHWLAAMALGGMGKHNPTSLLDRAPLRELLHELLDCRLIDRAIAEGFLDAISVTATGYSSGQSVSFFNGLRSLEPWNRVRRIGLPSTITIDHLMASSAIPFLFSAVKIHREYFGDGSMRQIAPISPALHLGANRVLVVGVRYNRLKFGHRKKVSSYPSLGNIAGQVLDSIFLDSLDIDLERMQRINKTISLIPSRRLNEGDITLRPIDVLHISPSEDIGEIAERNAHLLPRPVRYLLRGIGASNNEGSNLLSYLLFEQEYCRELITIGYADTMRRKSEVMDFLDVNF